MKVAVMGAGKLGELVLAGLLRSGTPVDQVLATARRPERAAELAERYGIRPVTNAEAVAVADVLVIGVKPQDAGKLLDELGAKVPSDKLVVSLCAGLPTSFFAERLPAGTTAAALRELEVHGLRAAFLGALEAARDRAREIAAETAR